MKSFYFISTGLLSMMLLIACEKAGLTKKTKEGKNTFSCVVDGQVFKNCGGGLFSGSSMSAEIRSAGAGRQIVYVYAGCSENNERKDFRIRLLNFRFGGEGEYALSDTNNVIEYFKSDAAPYDFTSKGGTGKIKITKDDREHYILSGEFAGTLCSTRNANDKIKIKSGRFDASTR